MSEGLHNTNGHRSLRAVEERAGLPMQVTGKQTTKIAQTDDQTTLQQVLKTVSSSRLIKMISKSLGHAEAEIEFTERIRIREE